MSTERTVTITTTVDVRFDRDHLDLLVNGKTVRSVSFMELLATHNLSPSDLHDAIERLKGAAANK